MASGVGLCPAYLIARAAGLPDELQIRDLRRTAATEGASAGATPCAEAGRVPYVGLSTVKMFPRWDR